MFLILLGGWGPGSDYGYVFSGDNTIQRINFPFDSGTSLNYGDLYRVHTSSGLNSSKFGYICGSNNVTVPKSSVRKFNFSFGTLTQELCGNLANTCSHMAGLNNSIYGYVAGGWTDGYDKSSIERFQFPFDSGISNIIGNLSNSTGFSSCSSCNSSLHGFVFPYKYSTVNRILFPFDTGNASLVGNLSYTSIYNQSSCNSSNYGYIATDYNEFSTIQRISFPFNSGTVNLVGNLSVNKSRPSACNSSLHGFVCNVGAVSRFQFPFDSGSASNVGSISGLYYENNSRCDGTDFVSMFFQ